jgi:hypothetical protein
MKDDLNALNWRPHRRRLRQRFLLRTPPATLTLAGMNWLTGLSVLGVATLVATACPQARAEVTLSCDAKLPTSPHIVKARRAILTSQWQPADQFQYQLSFSPNDPVGVACVKKFGASGTFQRDQDSSALRDCILKSHFQNTLGPKVKWRSVNRKTAARYGFVWADAVAGDDFMRHHSFLLAAINPNGAEGTSSDIVRVVSHQNKTSPGSLVLHALLIQHRVWVK